jgi:alpha-L-rhamnosidase
MAMDWALSTVLGSWETYVRYGDIRILEKHYPAMAETLKTLWSMTGGNPENFRGFGEWLDAAPGKMLPRTPSPWKDYGIGVNLPLHTPIPLSVGAFYAEAARVTALAARLTGRDPAEWEEMEKALKSKLRELYFKDGGFGSQGGNVLGLAFGILENEEEIQSAAAQLDQIIREEWNGHPNVGITASRDIAMVTGRYGYSTTARDLLLAEGYPGYLYNMSPPRTTIGSGWGARVDRTVQSHVPSVGRWFTEGLAGIMPSEDGPGYRNFVLQPQFPGGHPSASATLMTAQGEIASAWKREGGQIVWNVTVPWNSTATVKFPDGRSEKITAGKHQFTFK